MAGDIPEREVTDKFPATPEEFYDGLVTEAPLKSGDHGIAPAQMNMTKCEWFRPELIQEGKDFVKRNFYSVMLAHCISLLWVFTFKPGRAVLLRTGNSHLSSSRDRYLSTILHIKLWYESDFIDKAAQGSQDIYGVRKQHSAAARQYSEKETTPSLDIPELPEKLKKLLKSVQEELHNIDDSCTSELLHGDKPQVPMSQYSMAITQFCFIGFLVIMPKSFGISNTQGIDGFVHNWAIFGRLLGMEDKYNLAVHFLTMKIGSRTEAFHTIYQKMFLPNLKNVDATAIYMWNGLLEGFRHYMQGLRLKALIYYMIVYGTDVTKPLKLRELMGWKDKFSFNYIKFCTHSLSNSRLGRGFRNNGVRFSFHMAQRRYLPKWKRGQSNHNK